MELNAQSLFKELNFNIEFKVKDSTVVKNKIQNKDDVLLMLALSLRC